MKTKSKPSSYEPLPFYAIRALYALSSIIVTSIIFYFSAKLYTDKYKIPWTFIVVILASLPTLIVLLLTSIIHCCATLSPLLNLIFSIPLLVLWIVAFGLLAYNMAGMLAHSCSADNWATSTGVAVCNTYKTLFAFVVLGTLGMAAQIVLDIRARRAQNRLGRYDRMMGKAGERDSKTDVLLQDRQQQSVGGTNTTTVAPAEEPEFRDEIPGWRPGVQQKQPASYVTSTAYGHDETTSIHMSDFDEPRPTHQTQYDAGSHYAGQGGYGGHHDYQAYRDHDRSY